ncbi:MAG: hypothetical protein ACI88G_002351 [Woeseiaceae bacterium]|jgi:hypothetical protein
MHPFEGRAIYDPVTELLVTSILKSYSVRFLAVLAVVVLYRTHSCYFQRTDPIDRG